MMHESNEHDVYKYNLQLFVCSSFDFPLNAAQPARNTAGHQPAEQPQVQLYVHCLSDRAMHMAMHLAWKQQTPPRTTYNGPICSLMLVIAQHAHRARRPLRRLGKA